MNLGVFLQKRPFIRDLFAQRYNYNHPVLKTTLVGIDLPNPIGLAAGFDKNAKLLLLFYSLGFGFVEIGSVTAKACIGRDKPRLWTLPDDEAVINRLGLPSEGADIVANRLANQYALSIRIPVVGINIAKTFIADEEKAKTLTLENAILDYSYSFKKLYKYGDYITINISCPNSSDGKQFGQDPVGLNALLRALKKEENTILSENKGQKRKPILVKISADESEESLFDILKVCEENKIDGYVICNTTTTRDGLDRTNPEIYKNMDGGLSGMPLKNKSTKLIRLAYRFLKENNPEKKPQIMGVGGVESAEDVIEKIEAGATAVQILTGLIYNGPLACLRINKKLVKIIAKRGVNNIQELVGTNY